MGKRKPTEKTMKIKQLISASAIAALALPLAGVAQAQAPSYKAQTPEVVERGPDGRATVVMVDGKRYPVCMTEQQDGCIQPRAARLGWGDRPMMYWPGQPASQMRGR